MLFKRQEPFRYTFSQPIKGEIYCIEEKGKVTSTNRESVEILDLSPSGLKIKSTENFQISSHIRYSFQFSLDGELIQTTAYPIWKTNQFHYFIYGFKMEQSDTEKQAIIETLKQYSKKQHQLLKEKDKK